MNVKEIEVGLLDVINAYAGRLPAEQVKDMAELARAGEPGIAFENLCTQLYEYGIAVDDATRKRLQEIGSAMRLKSKYWDQFKVRG